MQEECQPCPQGSVTANVGATNLLQCLADVVPGGPCSTDPCNSQGVCIRRNTTYGCYCGNGYSGDNCEIAPDPCATHACQYGSTCVPVGEGVDDYECHCTDDYTGDFCQHRIVHGEWSEYGYWSACSTTCGEGQQVRYRMCNNPTPNTYGDYCAGNNYTMQTCNVRDCPQCPELPRAYGTTRRCTEDGDWKNCTLTCRDGAYTTKNYPTNFKCGRETGHAWDPEVDPNEMMNCGDTRFPSQLRTSSKLEFEAPGSSASENEVLTNQLLGMASDSAPCIDTGDCSATVHVSNDEGRKKRTSTLVFILTVDANVGEYNFMIDGVYDNETAVEGLTNLISFVNQLETLANVLNESVTNGSVALVIDGVTYYPDPEVLDFSGDVGCAPGETAVTFVCVNCPPGSYGDGTECTLCGLGEYQEAEGQVSCDSCADGYITTIIGSSNSSDCVEDDAEDSLEDDNDEDENTGDSSTGKREALSESTVMALAVSFAVLAVIVVAAVVIYTLKKNKKDHVTPSRPTSPSSWNDPYGSGMASPPPPYEEVHLRHYDSYGDEKPTNAVRYNGLPPLDTKATLVPKKPIGHQ